MRTNWRRMLIILIVLASMFLLGYAFGEVGRHYWTANEKMENRVHALEKELKDAKHQLTEHEIRIRVLEGK